MVRSVEFTRWRQLRLQQFTGGIERHRVGRDEFCALMLSRRSLERCDDVSAHGRGLLDPRTGDLFDIDERDSGKKHSKHIYIRNKQKVKPNALSSKRK